VPAAPIATAVRPLADFSQARSTMTRGRTLDLIIHGSRADNAELRAAADWARSAGHRVRAQVTWEAGDARRFAATAAARGTDAVIAVGGDGTLNEVLNGVVGTDASLGVLPLGTANDFARQIGMPDDPREGLALLVDQEPRPIDVGLLNGRAFLNVSTGGIGAETTAETSAGVKGVLGPLAYALTGMKKLAADYEGRHARFSGPDFSREVEYLLFAVGNARATGSGVTVAPLAEFDDGLLDLCVVEPVARTQFAKLLLELRRGEHLDRDGVHYVQTPWLRVEAEAPVAVNVDGEALSLTTLEYRVAHRAVQVLAPRALGEAPPDDAAGG
jgi:lipid kinase YegS